MSEDEKGLTGEIVKSGIWLYDSLVLHEVWIVMQNFEFSYEKDYADDPEVLNAEGFAFQIVFARDGVAKRIGSAAMSIDEAVAIAEASATTGIYWTNHRLGATYHGRTYSLKH